MNGPCDSCGRDSGDARRGGGLWLPPDSDPEQTVTEKRRDKKTGAVVVIERTRAFCSDCREDQDDGQSPWRSA